MLNVHKKSPCLPRSVNLCQNRLGGHKRCQSRSQRPAVPSDPPVFLLVWFGKYQFWANGTNTNCCIWEDIPYFSPAYGMKWGNYLLCAELLLGFACEGCLEKFSKKYSPKWWWTMVVYHATICKRITLRTKSKFGYPLRQLTYPPKKKRHCWVDDIPNFPRLGYVSSPEINII